MYTRVIAVCIENKTSVCKRGGMDRLRGVERQRDKERDRDKQADGSRMKNNTVDRLLSIRYNIIVMYI